MRAAQLWLAAVAGFAEADVDQLNEIYLHCNPTIDGHDSSGESVRPMLTPADLATDIATMDKLIENAKERRKAQVAREITVSREPGIVARPLKERSLTLITYLLR